MRSGNEQVKTQATLRRDGRITVTVKLIGYDPLELGSLEYRPELLNRLARNIRLKVLDTVGKVR